ncbi:DNA repair protein REV1-like isoform X1 [Myxocyprinus asiaticus]|uniref:DNA repair protein REV1-like isoform X1 n=2 Tax=Myxocyprinus asiaticus TaxID=70543 RepID=UPI002221B73B|nr:DNA repair protein REV1-like isoform X1 [Myxocyprinus asiaticus]
MSRDGWRKKASDDDGWGGRGGYMAAKISKLEEQFQKDAPREKQKDGTSSCIFSGVAIYVNGYTDPSADELRRLMMLHGGQFHVYYSRSKTTHIIATNLPNRKIQDLRGEKVVRPEWILDSIKAGHQLSYMQYQLYTKQKGLSFTTVCARGGQDLLSSCVPSKSSPSYPQSDSIQAQPSHTQTHSKEVLSNHPNNFTEQTNQLLDVRINDLCSIISEEDTQSSGVNGIHGGNHDDNACALLPRSSKDPLLSNGYVHPFNGALKPQDLVPLVEHPPQVVDTGSHQSHLPQGGHRDTDQPNCSSSGSKADQRPMISMSSPIKKSVAPNMQNYLQPKPTSHPGTLAAPEKANHLQDQTGRGRLNGSYHMSPNSTLADSSNQSGRSDVQGTEAGIISEFYSHSRLHHISTWRNEFSEYVNALQSRRRAAKGAIFSGKEKLKKLRANCSAGSSMPAPQVRQSCILHVDMDCFFVSVGIRHRPDLIGKPVAVTSNRGPSRVAQRPGANPQLEFQYYQRKQKQYRTGKTDCDLEMTLSPQCEEAPSNGVYQDQTSMSMAEIASCSYEARQAGVRNGMFFGRAKQLCPDLQSVPYDFQAYKEVALTMYETLASYTHSIEALSCDEALVDATALLTELRVTPDDLAGAIRADVKEKTGCSASVGMGSNILLARMATRKAKPNGQYFLRSEEVDDFIRDQPVSNLPGVGRSMSSKLASLGVSTCGDLQHLSMSLLQKEFGPRTGQTLFRFCRGLDDRPVRSEKERKSVSAEMNYNIRFTQVEDAESFLTNLSMEVQKRLESAGQKGRRLTLKVMMRKAGAPVEPAKYGGHGICDNLARSALLAQATDSGQVIAGEAIKLFHAMKLDVKDMRGVGLQVQQLDGTHTDPSGQGLSRGRSIKDLLLARKPPHSQSKDPLAQDDLTSTSSSRAFSSNQEKVGPLTSSTSTLLDPIPGTSKGVLPDPHTPNHVRTCLNLSIEVPSPSQVDHSVLEALPAELRKQVEQSWTHREERPSTSSYLSTPPRTSSFPPPGPPPGTLVLQLPNQPGQACATGIVLELPDFSQVDPDVFAALPKELQEELCSAYRHKRNAEAQGVLGEQKKPFPQLKQPAVGKIKQRYKRRNASPAKKGPSPLKKRFPGNNPAKSSPSKILPLPLKTENICCPSSPSTDVPETSKFNPRPVPTLAGAFEFSDLRTLLCEWVTTISDPMEEDILQVVKYCTELVEDKDLEKLYLVIKYMKRLMQQSTESVWSMAFDFILDNVQVVVQQTYGSTLKIT